MRANYYGEHYGRRGNSGVLIAATRDLLSIIQPNNLKEKGS
jgi:hypothetical protein